jgi:hypothetical protein
MLMMCGGAELRRTPKYTGAVSGVSRSAAYRTAHCSMSPYFSKRCIFEYSVLEWLSRLFFWIQSTVFFSVSVCVLSVVEQDEFPDPWFSVFNSVWCVVLSLFVVRYSTLKYL